MGWAVSSASLVAASLVAAALESFGGNRSGNEHGQPERKNFCKHLILSLTAEDARRVPLKLNRFELARQDRAARTAGVKGCSDKERDRR
jgi:hypothetical protein